MDSSVGLDAVFPELLVRVPEAGIFSMMLEGISGGTGIAAVGKELRQVVGTSEPQRAGFYSSKEEFAGDQDDCRRLNLLERHILGWMSEERQQGFRYSYWKQGGCR